MLALRQLEQGDCLSHLTLRLRHVLQLRGFETGPVAGDRFMMDAGKVELFPEPRSQKLYCQQPCHHWSL